MSDKAHKPNKTDAQQGASAPPAQQSPNPPAPVVSRRRLMASGSGLAILATLPGRQVLGQTAGGHNCTPSGFASVNLNLSDRPTGFCGGRTPAEWFNVLNAEDPQVTGTQTFASVFGSVPGGPYADDATLADILLSGNADNTVEFAAAYLSAEQGLVTITVSEVVGLYTAFINGLGYDTGSGLVLGASQIIPFLQGLYTSAI